MTFTSFEKFIKKNFPERWKRRKEECIYCRQKIKKNGIYNLSDNSATTSTLPRRKAGW